MKLPIPLLSMDPVDWLVFADNLEEYGHYKVSPAKCRRIGFVLQAWKRCWAKGSGTYWQGTPLYLTARTPDTLVYRYFKKQTDRRHWVPMARDVKHKLTEVAPSSLFWLYTPRHTNPESEWRTFDNGSRYNVLSTCPRLAWKFFATMLASAKDLMHPDDYKQYLALPRDRRVLIETDLTRECRQRHLDRKKAELKEHYAHV